MRSLPFLRGSYLAIATIASGCGDSCFVRGTRVATADGARLIESLVVGDVVLSYSHKDKAIVTRRVVAIHRSTVREVRTVEVIAEGRTERLRVTPSHPFWVDSHGDYVAVRDLRENDVLLLRSGSGVRNAVVRSITAEESSVPSVEVFNISVETPESNYFAEGVLVHNKEPVVKRCDSAEVVASAASKIADEGTTAARYRLEVTLPRSATLRVTGYGRSSGAAKADVPLSMLEAKNTGDGRQWTIELVVENGQGTTLFLSGDSTTDDGAACSLGKTIDPL